MSTFPQSISKKVDQGVVKSIPIENPVVPWNLGIITKKGRYESFAVREFKKMLDDR
ncbi:hypothetical protein [Bacillus vietnamensis]|uniref:hypothetical protein n=1 Tax=Rossellomorea vietnamensis TaxID=218284 RepID=UPI00128EA724